MVEKVKMMLDVLIKSGSDARDLKAIDQLALVIGIEEAVIGENSDAALHIKDCTNLIPFIESWL